MFSLLKGGQVYPFPPCLPECLHYLQYLVVTCCLLGPSLIIHVSALAVYSGMSKGLGWGGGFAWAWGPLALLPQ